jgi:hypothetical protein
MTNLEQTWRAWRVLSRADRARFLVMLREAYSREHEAQRDAEHTPGMWGWPPGPQFGSQIQPPGPAAHATAH